MLRPAARRDEIARLAAAELRDVADLAEWFSVSESTIRRDLSVLEDTGRITRTYGGAVGTGREGESSLRHRIGEAFDEKHAIATWVAGQVGPDETVVLDGGSTVAALAHELRRKPGLTVATTSLAVVEELKTADEIDVHCMGGTLRRLSDAFIGPIAEAALERMTFDRAFLGADGVDPELGICEAHLQQARIKELMAQRAKRTYVLVHGAKLGRRPFHAWARLGSRWTLVTTGGPSATEPFTRRGIEVVSVASRWVGDERSAGRHGERL